MILDYIRRFLGLIGLIVIQFIQINLARCIFIHSTPGLPMVEGAVNCNFNR